LLSQKCADGKGKFLGLRVGNYFFRYISSGVDRGTWFYSGADGGAMCEHGHLVKVTQTRSSSLAGNASNDGHNNRPAKDVRNTTHDTNQEDTAKEEGNERAHPCSPSFVRCTL